MACAQQPVSDHHSGLTFVRALYQCRELGAALTRYASAATLYNVKRSLGRGLTSDDSNGKLVSSGVALVAKLVLKELDAPEHHFTCPPTDEGLEVVQQVQHAVFGKGSLQQGLAECVYLANLAQAVQALELVNAALLDVVSPINCLSLFNVAAGCGCAPLRRKSHALALHSFPMASQQDINGLLTMEEEHLMRLLCSDSLQVTSEVDVFRALTAWTEYAPAARKLRFAARFARCVRLGNVTMADLYLLDAHPLVVSDRQATMLVAQVYMHLVMGVVLDCPLGLRTTSRLRHCQRSSTGSSKEGVAAAAGGQQQQQAMCGLAEHSSQHESVFEAVVCAFSRHRQQRQQQEVDVAQATAQAGMRRVSVGGCCPPPSSSAAVLSTTEPQAASTVVCAPLSSPAASPSEEPTPSNGAYAAAAIAPAVLQQTRVRHHGITKRVGSRRMLFDMAGASSAEELGSKPSAAEAAAPPLATVVHSSGGGSPGSPGARMAGGVILEMLMSPNRASMRGMAQEAVDAAAAALQLTDWESRKRLRFD